MLFLQFLHSITKSDNFRLSPCPDPGGSEPAVHSPGELVTKHLISQPIPSPSNLTRAVSPRGISQNQCVCVHFFSRSHGQCVILPDGHSVILLNLSRDSLQVMVVGPFFGCFHSSLQDSLPPCDRRLYCHFLAYIAGGILTPSSSLNPPKPHTPTASHPTTVGCVFRWQGNHAILAP